MVTTREDDAAAEWDREETTRPYTPAEVAEHHDYITHQTELRRARCRG